MPMPAGRRRAATAPLAALCTAAALAVAGCGGSGGGAATSTASPTTPAASTGAAATVRMEGVSFAPETTTVKVGGTVTWNNTSTISHNVTADAFASKTLDRGATFSHRFADAGTFTYLCTFHAGMKGTITVQ